MVSCHCLKYVKFKFTGIRILFMDKAINTIEAIDLSPVANKARINFVL